MIQTFARATALLIFGVIVYATLSSLGMRPRTGSVAFEREGAFFLFALALTIGFPSRVWLVAVGILAAVGGLELAQHLTPDRHGQLVDAAQKLAGGIAGVAFGWLVNRLLPA